MKLTFFGAAQQVTGSMYLLETDDNYKVLIDCGQDMEKKKEEKPQEHKIFKSKSAKEIVAEQKPVFPFEASDIDVVILTHAHIDHSGRLPLLYKEGYEGQILCTTPTFYLTNILLHDSANLNQWKMKKAMDKNKHARKAPVNMDELFFAKQVEKTMDRFVAIPTNQKFKLTDSISVTFNQTGHLLGAANLIFKIKENGEEKSICFSGDIGRFNYPLLQDPQKPPQVDYMICESTYGNRNHSNKETPEAALYRVIKKACIEKEGRLIIPAFSVGRSQALFYTLNKLYQNTDLPKIRIYADSPMAIESSKVYEKFVKQLNKEARDFYEENDELFDFDNFEFVPDLKKSKALSNHYEPCIIISSSGMISGGRVENHVKENLENSKSTICIVGFCAEGSIGHELMNGAKEVVVKNKMLEVRCDIEVLDCFSAHGDQNDLIHFVQTQEPAKLKKIFLTHGELKSMEALKEKLEELNYKEILFPVKGEVFEL